MLKNDSNKSCRTPSDTGCCKVESITVDDQGQIVLPKEIKGNVKKHADSKLSVISREKGW